MAASHFVEVTDEVKENAYFSNNHQCNYTKTILLTSEYREIEFRFSEYREIEFLTSTDIHLAFSESLLIMTKLKLKLPEPWKYEGNFGKGEGNGLLWTVCLKPLLAVKI